MTTYLESLRARDSNEPFPNNMHDTFYFSSLSPNSRLSILSTYSNSSQTIKSNEHNFIDVWKLSILAANHVEGHVATSGGDTWHLQMVICRVTCGGIRVHIWESGHMHKTRCDHEITRHVHGLNKRRLGCMHGSRSEVAHKGVNEVVCFNWLDGHLSVNDLTRASC